MLAVFENLKNRFQFLLIIFATTLHDMRQVDLGCGSGSLLEALLREPNTLEYMIGIDISRKALIRGAKVCGPLFTNYQSLVIFWIVDYRGSLVGMRPLVFLILHSCNLSAPERDHCRLTE